MNQYETVFILTPVLSDVQMKEAVEKFKGILTAGRGRKRDYGMGDCVGNGVGNQSVAQNHCRDGGDIWFYSAPE